jgi:hypothetical protein
MSRKYYIVDKAAFTGHYYQFSDAHYIDLPDTGEMILLSVEAVRCPTFCEKWEAWPGTVCIPEQASNQPVAKTMKSEHIAALAKLGVTILPNDSPYDLAQKIRTVHKLM